MVLTLVFMYKGTINLSGKLCNFSYSEHQSSAKRWGQETALADSRHPAEPSHWPEPPNICSKFTQKGELLYPSPWSSLQSSEQRKNDSATSSSWSEGFQITAGTWRLPIFTNLCDPFSYCKNILWRTMNSPAMEVPGALLCFYIKNTSYFKSEISSAKSYCFCCTLDCIEKSHLV